MARKRALVTGAYGLVGLNIVEELHTRGDWDALAIGRREKPPVPGLNYVRADLMDPAAMRAALAAAGDCTHLFFGAYQFAADPYEEIRVNVAMLNNTLDALRAVGAPLKHVVICEGSKAYGAMIGPMRTPAKERDPRIPGPLFYYDQEDTLFARGPREGFVTTVMRPDFIEGIGFGSYTNVVSTVAVYATVCKALGLPLYFPGGPAAYNMLFQMTDARLLARGMIWAAETGDKDEIYNITNGDLFRWSNVWPRVARYFDLEIGHPMNIDLSLFMRDKGGLWSELARKHGLAVPFEQMLDWTYGIILNVAWEIHTSTIRIRQAGFHECLDSEDRLFALFDEMRERKFIP
ncbi:MAG: SDR family oxidoreductase [Rhodospirillaceae bacterium]|nr:MAG: SDR family oxidoreductase [Rhodospirillaceae bacterium]